MRKLCIITSNRSDYWLLRPLIKYFHTSNKIKLQFIVSGAHLSEVSVSALKMMQEDGFPIDFQVECHPTTDDHIGLTRAISQGVIGFSNAFAKLKPDLLLILGDRFEIFSAAQSAYCLKIPIVHLHGGELSYGSLDDGFRHAISKFSQLHFVSNKEYKARLVRMGEHPDNIVLSGAIGIDKIHKFKPLNKDKLSEKLNFDLKKYFLFTFHPTTLDKISIEKTIHHLNRLFDEYADFQILITSSNPDPSGIKLNKFWQKYRDQNSNRVCFVYSLGNDFHSAVYHSRFVIGNSSSSIIEVPYLGKWVINIGRRQCGRISSSSTIHVDHDFISIKNAIQMVLSRHDPAVESPYGEPGTVLTRIVSEIGNRELENLLYKEFYDS